MLVFLYPIIFAYTLLGVVTGALVGRKLWGITGAAVLGTSLALAPLFAAYFVFGVAYRYELGKLTRPRPSLQQQGSIESLRR